MVLGLKRASRALRLLLACTLLWLAAGAHSQGALEQRAVAVMIAPARPSAAPAEVARRAARAAAPVLERRLAPEPVPASAALVLIEDRYLRFCSLLS